MKVKPSKNGSKVTAEDLRMRALNIIENAQLTRVELFNKMLDPRRDLDEECGYPKDISLEQYKDMFERDGIGARIVTLYPEECWAIDPEVFEVEDPKVETEFEKAWADLVKRYNVWHFMERADEMSGIGQFAIMLLGIGDGRSLDQPVPGVEDFDVQDNPTQQDFDLLYIKCLDQTEVQIGEVDADPSSKRYGLPITYEIMSNLIQIGTQNPPATERTKVHWTRVIHLADGRLSSEVLGTPRGKRTYNRVADLRKILGGSAEMFWRGAFPGISFEVDPSIAAEVDLDEDALREEMDKYMNHLSRYIALQGVSAKSLAPQVADPAAHIRSQLEIIAISLGCPLRIFLGSEEAKLAATQDIRTWNRRMTRRQTKYLDPWVIRPFINRCMAIGALPIVKEYFIDWPDLNAPTDDDKANTAKTIAEALAAYVAGDVAHVWPPFEFLTMVFGLTLKEAEQVMDAAEKQVAETANPKTDVLARRIIGPPPLDPKEELKATLAAKKQQPAGAFGR